jgi:hypothetical protein
LRDMCHLRDGHYLCQMDASQEKDLSPIHLIFPSFSSLRQVLFPERIQHQPLP